MSKLLEILSLLTRATLGGPSTIPNERQDRTWQDTANWWRHLAVRREKTSTVDFCSRFKVEK